MASNIFSVAKKIRKQNPSWAWQKCVKEAGKQNRTPAKKVSGSSAKKSAGVTKRVTTTTRRKTVKETGKLAGIGGIGMAGIGNVLKDQNKIDTFIDKCKNNLQKAVTKTEKAAIKRDMQKASKLKKSLDRVKTVYKGYL